MTKRKICYLITMLLIIIICSSLACSRKNKESLLKDIYFNDANEFYENGQLDEAISSYKSVITAINDEDDEVVQFCYLQLAKIFYAKGLHDKCMEYCDKITNKYLFFDGQIVKPAGEDDFETINYWGYGLKDKANKLRGLIYQSRGNYKSAIECFEKIKDGSSAYYYLGVAYGLSGDRDKQIYYFKKNIGEGEFRISESRKWLKSQGINE